MKKLLLLAALSISAVSYSQEKTAPKKKSMTETNYPVPNDTTAKQTFFSGNLFQTFFVMTHRDQSIVRLGSSGLDVIGDSLTAIKMLLKFWMLDKAQDQQQRDAVEEMFGLFDSKGNIADTVKYRAAFAKYIHGLVTSKNKVYINDSKDGQFYYTVTGDNGEVLVTSETQKQKQSIEKGIAALAEAMKDFEIIDRTKPKSKNPKK